MKIPPHSCAAVEVIMKIRSKDIYIFVAISSRLITIMALASFVSLGIIEKIPNIYFRNTATCLMILFFTYIPLFLQRRTELALPYALQAAIIAFIFLSVFLGEVVRFYDKFHWWDFMLHVVSGVVLGLVGFYMLCSLNSTDNAVFQMSRFNICVFVFSFALALGVLWEVFEFAGDSTLGMNMQKSVYVTDMLSIEAYVNKWGRLMDPGLVDTMKDLMADMIGAALSSAGSLYILKDLRKAKAGK